MTQHVPPLVEVVEVREIVDDADGDSRPTPGAPGSGIEPVRRRARRILSRLNFSFLQTLTGRLVAGVVALVVIVVAVIGSVTYYNLRSFLYTRLDQQVNSQADQALASANLNNPYVQCDPATTKCVIKQTGRFGQQDGSQAQWIAFLSPLGEMRSEVSSNSNDLRSLEVSATTRSDLAREERGVYTVTTTSGDEIRVATRPADGFVVVSGISTDEVDGTLHRLLIVELLIGAAGVVLAFVLTAGGMYLGLQPLKRVTRTAREVTAELSPEGAGLDRRVPETDSSTEVGQLASSFNAMLDTVETEFRARRESEERMRQFLADASHELRTPLTSIRGYAELERLRRARSGTQPPGGDDTIGRIEAEGTRMSRLVDDLLILARGDDADNDSALDRSSIDVQVIVADVVAGVRAAHPARVIVTQVEPGLTVWGDHDQIVRVLRNLTTNAAVHTDPSGPIRINAHRAADNAVLQVIDAGPGLSPEEAQHVFERFWRADKARTRVKGGSGLGMAIVAQIVHAHGGHVDFDSSVEHGSTVTVVLPGAA